MEVGEIRGFVEDNMTKAKDLRSIAEALTKKYPADQDTISRAIAEIAEQKALKYPIPTDKRVTIEDWEDYIIIQCCFGLLVNRTLSRLIGHVLSEKKGYTIGVQQDPYRVVIQTQGAANSEDAIEVLRELSKMNIEDVMVVALLKTGLFKRRLMHVARKFGAISKTADFGELSLQQLMKSFAGSIIFDETIKFTLEEDFDIENTKSVLRRIQSGDIEVARIISTQGEPTPTAKLGMEQISWKTDLIPPEKMRRLLIESAKARLVNEVRTFVCIDCWEFVQMIRISDLPDHLMCPRCGSKNIGVLDRTEEDVLKICNRVGRKMSTFEKKIENRAIESSKLMSNYGKVAAIVLSGKGIEPKDAELVLVEECNINDHLFGLIVDAERKALIKGFL
jgi:ATP-dependent Lhr-like helicase